LSKLQGTTSYFDGNMGRVGVKSDTVQCTEVRFASFLSGGFITAIVVNLPERKLCSVADLSYA
jgi:hypothetical protein